MNLASLARAGALCAVGWLAGCNSTTVDSYRTLKLAVSGAPPLVTTDLVAALDRPALAAELGQSQALLVLASRNGQIAEWHGLDQMLVLQNGRLVQSAGLPDGADVTAPLVANDPFLHDLRAIEPGLELTRLVDLPKRYLTDVPQHARYSNGPVRTLTIHGKNLRLQRLDEHVSMPALGFRAHNRYWFDPATGRVVMSEQHLGPGLPLLRLTELLPSDSAGAAP